MYMKNRLKRKPQKPSFYKEKLSKEVVSQVRYAGSHTVLQPGFRMVAEFSCNPEVLVFAGLHNARAVGSRRLAPRSQRPGSVKWGTVS